MIEKKSAGRTSKRPPKEELTMKYHSMTAKQLADEYGVAVSTVRGWIQQYRKEDQERRRDYGDKQ